ncbi:Zinc finger RNAbinding proteinlike, partial [Caligus rogercresseyi]
EEGEPQEATDGIFPSTMGGGGSGPMSYGPPGFKGKMTLDDHYVITKHKNIYPKEDELDGILKLVTKLEEGLRSVSDELAEAKRGDKEEEEDKEKHRDIMGVARVGDLAKGLILSSDVVVDIVIISQARVGAPSPKLEDYELTERLEEAGFHVSSPPLLARVCLTSSKVKEEGAFEGLEDPLSKEKTLEALTELKRSNWFGSMA